MQYKSRLRICCVAASCLGFMLAVSSADAAIIIDDFSITEDGPMWQEKLTVAPDSAQVSETMAGALDNVVGGRRITTLDAVIIGLQDFDFVRGTLSPTSGIFDYASTANAHGHLSFFYDGIDPNFSIDISGMTGIMINFLHFDFANGTSLPVTITLSDSVASASHSMALGMNELDLFFLLTDFGGVDLSDIRSIQVDFAPDIGMDFRLAHMSVIPSPAVLAALGIGGLIGVRRRRRTNQ
jgi:hypothetical protein